MAGLLLESNVRLYWEASKLERYLEKCCIESAKDYVKIVKGGVGSGVCSYYGVAEREKGDRVFSKYQFERDDFLVYRKLNVYEVSECR